MGFGWLHDSHLNHSVRRRPLFRVRHEPPGWMDAPAARDSEDFLFFVAFYGCASAYAQPSWNNF